MIVPFQLYTVLVIIHIIYGHMFSAGPLDNLKFRIVDCQQGKTKYTTF